MADIFNRLKRKRRADRNSVYSMVSSSELTPGSLEVWVDLPDEIKFDSSLEPFKRLYEQQHGTLDSPEKVNGDEDSPKFNVPTIHELTDKTHEGHIKDCENRLLEHLPQDEDKKEQTEKGRNLQNILHVIKLSTMVACWMLLTVSLIMNMEKTDVVLHTAVKTGEIKEYQLEPSSGRLLVAVTITGPFKLNASNKTSNALCLWLHRENSNMQQDSKEWLVYLQPEDSLDFSPSVTESKTLILEQDGADFNTDSLNISAAVNPESLYNEGFNVSLRMETSSNITVPLTLTYMMNALDERDGIIYSTILLCALYFLVIFEVVNRTIAALLCSSLGIAVLALSGARPTLPELVSWLDVETLLLLFSMMILVAILAETGLFDYLAVLAFEITGGHTWPLINCLCFFTAFFSTFLDNVTTVLLMTPVTIRLCEVMQLNPVPVLMSMVIFSNVGGAATPVGDPPNVIIASYPAMLEQNINFTTFTLHMGIGILLVCIQTYFQLRFMFRDMSKLRHTVPIDIIELRQEIAVWRRAAASLSSYSRDEDIVRKTLEKKVMNLNSTLKKREAGRGNSKSDPKFCSTLAQMKEKYKIRDKVLLIKSAVCVLFVVVVFFLHVVPELQRLSLGWTALLGALLLLLLADRKDLEPILARVEWATLLFFAALFVLMEVLSKLGLISWIGKMTEAVILSVDEKSQLAVALLLVLWVSGVSSAFVDNIPLTSMMVRVVGALASPRGLGLPLAPLAWALSLGACLGGNGTLIGASANVVCAGVAEQHGYRFTFLEYLKVGFPVMVGNLLVASVYLLVCHVLFSWH